MTRRLCIILALLLHTAGHAAEPPRRVITIGGALTEIVFELGKQDVLVGCDTTSYYPPAAEDLPKVGYQRALSAEGILSLKPDRVILTTEAGPAAVLEQLRQAGIEMVMLEEPHSIDGVINKIERVAVVLGAKAEAAGLTARIRRDLTRLEAETAVDATRPRVLFILQQGGGSPLVAGRNTAADAIIALSGARNAVIEYEGYKPLTPESAVSYAPDAILITTQGLEHAGGKEGLLSTPGLGLTPAGREGRVIALDSLLMLGFGPRTVEAASRLSAAYRSP